MLLETVSWTGKYWEDKYKKAIDPVVRNGFEIAQHEVFTGITLEPISVNIERVGYTSYTRVLGSCGRPDLIKLFVTRIDAKNVSRGQDKDFVETIIHELAHAARYQKVGTETKKDLIERASAEGIAEYAEKLIWGELESPVANNTEADALTNQFLLDVFNPNISDVEENRIKTRDSWFNSEDGSNLGYLIGFNSVLQRVNEGANLKTLMSMTPEEIFGV